MCVGLCAFILRMLRWVFTVHACRPKYILVSCLLVCVCVFVCVLGHACVLQSALAPY